MSDLASDLTDLTTLPPVRRGPTCSVAEVLERLAESDPAGRDALAVVIENEQVPAVGLSVKLVGHGISLKPHTIRRHRKRAAGAGCTCPA